jgi:hypothetical protein
MEKVAIGMLGYYSYLECQVFHLLKETGFLPKQVDMLPGYTRISRGVIEKSCNCALVCLVIILIKSAKFSTFPRKQGFFPSRWTCYQDIPGLALVGRGVSSFIASAGWVPSCNPGI